MINFSNVIYSFLCVFFTLFVLWFLFSPEYNTSGHASRPPEALVEGGVEFENIKDTIFYFRYTKKSKKNGWDFFRGNCSRANSTLPQNSLISSQDL